MPVVRYIALAALVLWLGSAVQNLAGERLHPFGRVTYVCGTVMIVALSVMKLVGPPPHAFVIRIVLVALAIAVTALGAVWGRSMATTTISLGLGLALLSWYARE
jgi:hypothetical protein